MYLRHYTAIVMYACMPILKRFGCKYDRSKIVIPVISDKVYTLCLQKVPTFELFVTRSNCNRFSKYLHCWKAYEICYKTHIIPHLRHVATLPWEIKIQTFCWYSVDMEENANKLHYLSPLTLRVVSHTDCKYNFSIYCSFAINLWHQKFVTADVTAVFVDNQHGIQRRGQNCDKTFICN